MHSTWRSVIDIIAFLTTFSMLHVNGLVKRDNNKLRELSDGNYEEKTCQTIKSCSLQFVNKA